MNDTLWNIFAIIGIIETVSLAVMVPTFILLMRNHNVKGTMTKDEWKANRLEEATMDRARQMLTKP